MKEITIYTIYDHPIDYPSRYVLRKSFIKGGQIKVDTEVKLYEDLGILREEMVDLGLAYIPRSPEDEDCILECWLRILT
jgi:hypothetical protein